MTANRKLLQVSFDQFYVSKNSKNNFINQGQIRDIIEDQGILNMVSKTSQYARYLIYFLKQLQCSSVGLKK